MKEKIDETKKAILDRIIKAVKDKETKLSPENLTTLTCIICAFDNAEKGYEIEYLRLTNDKEKNDYFAQTMKSLYKGKDNSKLLEIKGNETI